MVKQKHRALSIVLCLILAVSAICAGTVGAFAATGDTVYVKVNNGWSKVYAYMWTEGSGNNRDWPGVEMTKVEDGVYSYNVTGDFNMIIFNNGSGGNGNQTSNLSYAGNGKIYDLSKNSWSDYSGAVQNPTNATNPTGTTQPTTSVQPTNPSGDGITVYLKNEAGWSNPNCYMWTDGAGDNSGWPGEPMVSIGDNVYQYTVSKAYEKCIFNTNGTQTGNLTAKDGYIYNNKTNEWSVYDTSPLQIKSFSAVPSNGIYVDSSVALSAEAVNKNGAKVSYKFSVTNALGGTSVISNYSSASSVVWTPSAAGTYTITFDVKDTEGNENSRTLSLKVEDDTLLTKPVIKSVFPGKDGLIKVNSPATVSVKAGGGNTGTKLLFYKYIVKDPNGVENTPYYTLNKTYTFTPKMLGTYNVTVYVQASDNSTTSQSFSYTATNSDVTVPATEPQTTVEPTTAPATDPKPTTAPVTDPKPTEPQKLLGDVDGNKALNVTDVTLIQKYLVGYELTVFDSSVADVDKDGSISIIDATMIQKIIAGYFD